MFSKRMEIKSNSELEAILNDKTKYTDLTIQAAIWELEKRTSQLSEKHDENEDTSIDVQYINEHKELAQSTVEDYDLKEKGFWDLDENLVEDQNAPELYSQQLIYFISILFSTIFGSILLYSNLKEIKNKEAGYVVILFGLALPIMLISIFLFIKIPIYLPVIINIMGAKILTQRLWNKYIGEELTYRSRKIIFI